MAALINHERRARARAASSDRQRRILEVARDMLRRLPVGEISLETVCNRADVKAGLGSMYFGSRDQLFLRIAREEADAWLNRVITIIDESVADPGVADVARRIAADLASRELLVRLLAQVWMVLEGRVETGDAMAFVRWQSDRAREVGTRLHAVLPDVSTGAGERAMLRLQQHMAAWVQGWSPRGPLEVALGLPELEAARCDLEAEVRRFLERELGGREDGPDY